MAGVHWREFFSTGPFGDYSPARSGGSLRSLAQWGVIIGVFVVFAIAVGIVAAIL